MMSSIPVLFVVGGALLIAGAELLVRAAARLAVAAGISPLVVGLTVVAFGTSSPELAVTVGASLSGQSDVALGNIVGSNICNGLFILGASALIAPLMVSQQLVRLEVPIMIGASMAVFLLALDGLISRTDGLLLFMSIVAYTVFAVRRSRRETAAVQAKYDGEFASPAARSGKWILDLVQIAVGLALLVLGAHWLVGAAVALAAALGVSELVIGLTVVAIGTSLPEIATSILASIRGERDIAVGNIVGSNLFNLLTVLGLGSLAAPTGIAVPPGALSFDIPVMIASSVAALPIFFTGYKIARWEGAVFLAYYCAYTAYLLFDATEHPALPAYSSAMLYFVLPLTGLTLAGLAMRAVRKQKRAL
jgi:cation:H+ antiporter